MEKPPTAGVTPMYSGGAIPVQQPQPPIYHSPLASPPPQQQAGWGAPPPEAQCQPPPQVQYIQPPTVVAVQSTQMGVVVGGYAYRGAAPIASLNRSSAPVDCPACGQRAMTIVSYEIGNTTHAWAFVMCWVALLGCIPYLMNSLKDVEHKCGRCSAHLATWHRSGRTDVHMHC